MMFEKTAAANNSANLLRFFHLALLAPAEAVADTEEHRHLARTLASHLKRHGKGVYQLHIFGSSIGNMGLSEDGVLGNLMAYQFIIVCSLEVIRIAISNKKNRYSLLLDKPSVDVSEKITLQSQSISFTVLSLIKRSQ